jgi:hypothetical protein
LADGILILHQGIIDKGTNLTITLANIYSRPLKVTDLSKTYDLTEIKNFIFRFQNLMIAGPRESHSPGIYNKTKHFLRQVMRKS